MPTRIDAVNKLSDFLSQSQYAKARLVIDRTNNTRPPLDTDLDN